MSLAKSWVEPICLPLIETPGKNWTMRHLHGDSTSTMGAFACHISQLRPGGVPHPPHGHAEEELLVMLCGEADIITIGKSRTESRAGAGWIVYHPAHLSHTIRSAGGENACYLVFKWWGTRLRRKYSASQSSLFYFDRSGAAPAEGGESVTYLPLFEFPTRYLGELRCHVTELRPGAGYPPHSDPYDVAIVTLSGTLETLNRPVEPNSIIFYAAGEPHGMRNAGRIRARYLVMEFHAHKSRVRSLLLENRLIRRLASLSITSR